MGNDRSRKALTQFLDYLADKGLMAKNTAIARKAAVSQVLGILSEEEASDVFKVDLTDVMARFQNLEGRRYTPGSLSTYQSRVRAALNDFDSYLKNPLAFRPSVQTRERSPRPSTSKANDASAADGGAPKFHAPRLPGTPSMASTILPIPIRSDLTIHVQGLPYDLSEAEARKVANVILALATK